MRFDSVRMATAYYWLVRLFGAGTDSEMSLNMPGGRCIDASVDAKRRKLQWKYAVATGDCQRRKIVRRCGWPYRAALLLRRFMAAVD